MRRRSGCIVFLIALSACSVSSPPGVTSDLSQTPSPSGTPAPGRSPGSTSSPGTGLPGSPSSAPTIPAASYNDSAPLGAMARTFLRSSPARRLIVEVDYVVGYEPSSSALTHLQRVLSSVCDKPGGVVVERGSPLAESKQTYSVDDIKALERSARARRSAGDTATIWIAYLNGSMKDAGGALGVAFEASGAAVFRERIDDATTAVFLASEIERSVITHEVGHLLALVNIGYKSKLDHEDAAHPHHSNNQSSVMYWAVDDVSVRNLLGGGPPDDFDDADRADLATLRSG